MEKVSITQDDETHDGTYNVADGILTVSYDGKEKAREIGDDAGHPLELAKVILGEMVEDARP